MHVMRRLKSIASGRSSFSDPTGDSGAKRAKFDEERKGKVLGAPGYVEHDDVALHQPMPAATLVVDTDNTEMTDCGHAGKNEHIGVQQLPKEMYEMKLADHKVDHQDDKVPSQSAVVTVVSGNGTEAGHIIKITIGGENGQPKEAVSYMAERVVGTGSFGVVFQVRCLETGQQFAIKKVLQDRRYKNRELQIMKLLDHPNVIKLRHCFFSTNEKDELYLNLVLEYVPETVYRVSKHYSRMDQRMPIIYVQLYTYQILRSLAYIHGVLGVCHRDIKPQNLLVNPHTHQLKLCDFGSAKVLVAGEPNISYICSRYYRAPELIFGATEYTTAIDMWSVGCVLAELLLGQLEACAHPFFNDLRDPNARLPNGCPFPPLFDFQPQELEGAS